MINSKKRGIIIIILFFITLVIGINMVVAINSNVSDTSNHTQITCGHNMISTNYVNDTQKEETQEVKINKSSINTKVLKKDTEIKSLSDLVNNMKNNGVYTLKNNITLDKTLTTYTGVNTTINGNGYGLIFTKNGKINIVNNSVLNMVNITLNGNNIERQTSGIVSNGNLTIINSVVENFNNTLNGGAIYNNDSSTLSINNCTFLKNYGLNGGVIYSCSNIDITSCNFTNNHASNHGGAIFDIGGSDEIRVSNSSFVSNSVNSTTSMGGAFSGNAMMGEYIFNNVTFNNNFATNGGAISSTATGLIWDMKNLIFINNQAYTSGGAIYIKSNNTFLEIDDSTIINNKAISSSSYGGAIALDLSNIILKINNNKIINNSAVCTGGAIYASQNNSIYIVESQLTGNIVTNNKGNGGAVYTGSKLYSESTIFTDNNAENGGAIYIYGIMANVIATVFYNNSNNIYSKDYVSFAEENWWGTNNVTLIDKSNFNVDDSKPVIFSAYISNYTYNLVKNITTYTVILDLYHFLNDDGSYITLDQQVKLRKVVFSNDIGSFQMKTYEETYTFDLKGNKSSTPNITVTMDGQTINLTTINPLTIKNNTKNTIKEESNTIDDNNTSLNMDTKVLKLNSIRNLSVKTWSELAINIKYGGVFTLSQDLIANTRLNTNGGTNATIDGAGYKIIFKSSGQIGVSSRSVLTIQNIILDANNTSRTASGIINEGYLSIINSTMQNFNDTSNSSVGGVICNRGGNSTYINNIFKNNSATRAGVTYNTKSNCLYINNTFQDNCATYGGAICNSHSTCNITDNNFINNNAKTYGGAIYNYATNGSYTNNKFINNSASYGGAIVFSEFEEINVKNCSFINNYANYTSSNSGCGGAIFNSGTSILSLDNCTFSKNYGFSGGAIYNAKLSTLNINSSTFEFNYVKSSSKGSLSGRGGAIMIGNGLLNLSNSTFINNTAQKGGAISLNSGTNIQINTSNFINNTADVYGGAIFVYYNLNITACNFISNSVLDKGGAIFDLGEGDEIRVKDSNFVSNTAKSSTSMGGAFAGNTIMGIYDFSNVTFNNNSALSGGAISSTGTGLIWNIKNSTFNSNKAFGNESFGGAISIKSTDTLLKLEDSILNNNQAYGDNLDKGGAIALISSHIISKIKNNQLINNSATYYGGSIYSYTDNSICIVSSKLINNSVISNKSHGGAIYTRSQTYMSSNTFTNNYAKYGGAIFNYESLNSVFRDNLFEDNVADYDGAAIYIRCNGNNITHNTLKNNLVNISHESGGTLYINGNNNTISNNTYFNNTISFTTKTITSTINEDKILINTTIKLKKPEYYDTDILNKTNYTLHINKKEEVNQIKQENSTFNISSTIVPCEIYETLSIAQSTYDNYKTNTINITPKQTNTTINIENIKYGETLKVNGVVTNITSGILTIKIKSGNIIVSNKNININTNGKWNTTFNNLTVGSYNLTVTYTDTTGSYSNFENTTLFKVEKKDTNTTINIKNTTYPEKIIISGQVNIINTKLNINIANKTKTIIVNNTNWSTTFENLNVGTYKVIVSYNGDTNHEAFTNTTTLRVSKQKTNTTINTNNTIIYGNILKINGKTTNITSTTLKLTIGTTTKTVRVINNTWNITFENLNVGTYKVSVSYNGDTNHEAFTNTTNIIVNKAQTIITSKNITSQIGKNTKIEANVTYNRIPVNSGNVIIKVNNKTYTTTINNGKISYNLPLTTDNFERKDYNVTFIYSGSSTVLPTQTNTVLTVTGFKPVIKVSTTNNTYIGDTITITVKITNGTNYYPKDGKVGLKINDKISIAGKSLTQSGVNSTLTFKINATKKLVGNNNVTIIYTGNGQFNDTKTTITNLFTVLSRTRVTCTVNKATGILGQKVVLTAKFTSMDGKTLNGQKVVVKINGKTFGNTTIKNGIAQFTQYLNPTQFGGYNYKLTFIMGENKVYSGATNKNILTVTKYDTTFNYNTTVAKVGSKAKITVKITNKDKTFSPNSGTVGIKINGQTYKVNNKTVTAKPVNGVVTFNIPIIKSMIGNINITFTYSGNSQFNTGRTTMTNGLIIKKT